VDGAHGGLSLTTLPLTGVRGLFDGLTGTLLRQMTYSTMRFAVYDKAKAAVHTGERG
jgi:dicarboxylate transporter 10